MKTRILTAVIALAVFVGILMLPPVVFTISLGAVILVMLYECYTATKADIAMKIVDFVSAVLVMFILWVRTSSYPYFALFYMPIIYCVFGIILLLNMALVIFEHKKHSYKDILSNAFITIYISFSMMCIWLTRHYFDTNKMIIIFMGAWMTDTCAYFFGRLFGKHKLIPNVSPNKTVEGSIGGVIGAIVFCALYLFIYSQFTHKDLLMSGVNVNYRVIDIAWLIGGAGIGLLCGVFSQLGDLAASAIKRDVGIKDFGWIFPGHGGFMDRFDSVMFVSPIVLVMMIIMNGLVSLV